MPETTSWICWDSSSQMPTMANPTAPASVKKRMNPAAALLMGDNRRHKKQAYGTIKNDVIASPAVNIHAPNGLSVWFPRSLIVRANGM